MNYQTIKLDDLTFEQLVNFAGINEEHIKTLEELYHVSITLRDNELKIFTDDEKTFTNLSYHIDTIVAMIKNQQTLTKHDIEQSFSAIKDDHKIAYDTFSKKVIAYNYNNQAIRIKTLGQAKLMDAIKLNDIVFASGPAGTGKTFLAVVNAVNALKAGEVKKIVLTRPAVEAGESLGFLPGDLKEKVDPYLMPLYDSLYELLGQEKVETLVERNVIEIVPLAYMRGRTLNDSFIILDEAQNTTSAQMLMFLTRLGQNSKMVITGDLTQIDLYFREGTSGLLDASRRLKNIKGIEVIKLTGQDVVRNPLVQKIIEQYGNN